MSIFQKAMNTQAFLKMGMFGFEGSGKTFTSSLIAIGLHKHIKSDKPVAFFDTETGSDYVLPLFKAAGVELITVKARDLKTLAQAIKEAEQAASVMIIDSLTHIYREACSSYIRHKKDGTRFIRLQDWQPIKDTWHDKFSGPYVNSKLHIIWCSRAKNLFEDVLDEAASRQSGREQFKSVSVGTGARSETESSYEPSLLVEMERVMLSDGGRFARRMRVLKERFNVIDGLIFDFHSATLEDSITTNAPFSAISPHVKLLNIGGDHVGFREGSSESIFSDGYDDGPAFQVRKRRAVALETIENCLIYMFPSTGGHDRQMKLAALERLFGTTSWTDIKGRSVESLEGASDIIRKAKEDHEKGRIFKDANDIKVYLSSIDTAAATRRDAQQSQQLKPDKPTEEEWTILADLVDSTDSDLQKLLNYFGLSKPSDMTRDQYESARRMLHAKLQKPPRGMQAGKVDERHGKLPAETVEDIPQ